MKKVLTLALALSVGVAAPALAGKSHHGGHKDFHATKFFNEMDTNNDGVVNQSEHRAFTQRMFREADTNKDRLISRQEMETQMHKEHARHDMHRHGHDRDYDRMSPASGMHDYNQNDHYPRSGSAADRRHAGQPQYYPTPVHYEDQRYPSERYNDRQH